MIFGLKDVCCVHSFINLDYGYMIVLGDKDHGSSILEVKKEQNRTEQ